MNITALVTAAALLSGCASSEALYSRDTLRAWCASGDALSCRAVPAAELQVSAERSQNTQIAVLGVLGTLLLGVAAIGDARDSQPTYVIVREHHRWR